MRRGGEGEEEGEEGDGGKGKERATFIVVFLALFLEGAVCVFVCV